jgi:peptide/nickel transport system substrate-binding protein
MAEWAQHKRQVRPPPGIDLAMAALPAAAQKKGGTLVMVVCRNRRRWPYLSTSGPIGRSRPRSTRACWVCARPKPKPGLAKSWDVAADGRNITFKLQDG